ncbi:MAG: LPS export ABC transporter periplasmic protein LptC, partial [Thermoanaerobaculia bacterium]
MARGQSHRPLILLRWILLALLLVAGGTVLRIYLSRDTQPPPPRAVAGDPESLVESADVVLAAEGFEYEVIDEGVTLFFIRSRRMVSDRDDRFVLEGVELRMEEENGDLYTVASDRAVYDLESRDATLEGSVVMTGPDGVELRGEAFELENGGKILESSASPVA